MNEAKQRCWVCWRELGKNKGVYTFRIVERPGTGHLKVHKACEKKALDFLGETRPIRVPINGDGEHIGGEGHYVTLPSRLSDDR